MMTRKDYVALAEALREVKPDTLNPIEDIYFNARLDQWQRTVHRINAALADTNPLYDPTRFLEAAGAIGVEVSA